MRIFKKGAKVFFFEQDVIREWTIVSPREKTCSYKVTYQSEDWYKYSTDVRSSNIFDTESECVLKKIENLKAIVKQWESNVKYHEDCLARNKDEMKKTNEKIDILLTYLPTTNG